MSLITTLGDAKDGAELTKDEARLLQLYRQLDKAHKDYMLSFAENFSASYRVAKPAPAKASLHLIKGGAT